MLIAMAVYDTVENARTWMTNATLESLYNTISPSNHRVIVSDNGSCPATHRVYELFKRYWPSLKIIYNEENLGTAKAINKAWALRKPGEHAVKMDNDVTINQNKWADVINDAFSRDPTLGILGLKRNDLAECPWETGQFKSTLRMLPHDCGQRWIIVEDVAHVIGTCQAYSSNLLDRIGYLMQPGLYGFDDSLSSIRAKISGFTVAFLCGVEINHLDPGGSAFGAWKIAQADAHFDEYKQIANLMRMGVTDIYCEA